ncbi:MAG: hypothetical protein AAGK66_07000 [Pseudomonadota bacterium]
MTKQVLLSAISLAALAACSTPGIKYEARLMPDNIEAAATRNVAVERFAGPGSRWYTRQFETMLINTIFDGEPWFSLAAYADPDPNIQSGVYGGDIDVIDYSAWEDFRTRKKCIEWDGLFDCETRADVEEICYHQEVRVSVSPRLIEIGTGEVLFADTYFGDASSSVCEEIGVVAEYDDDKKRRRAKRRYSAGFTPVFYDAPRELIIEALSDTLRPIRRDIAPRNATVKAKFMKDALDPMVMADPRFEQAVDLGLKNPAQSCGLWQAMAESYPQAPSVIHNNAACAEASQQFEDAQALYAEAANLSLRFSQDGQTIAKPIREALENVSGQRFDLQLLNEITGRLPVKDPTQVTDAVG